MNTVFKSAIAAGALLAAIGFAAPNSFAGNDPTTIIAGAEADHLGKPVRTASEATHQGKPVTVATETTHLGKNVMAV